MAIVNIGAHKTGTTSLTEVMKRLNYKCYNRHEKDWYKKQDRQDRFESGDYSDLELVAYDFYYDSPYNINDVYKHLGDAKIIITLREPNEWFDSFLRWVKKRPHVNSDESDVVLAYGGKIIPKNSRIITRRYVQRIHDIYEYFGFYNVCRIHVKNPKKEKVLSDFLGVEIDFKWPHMNKT